MLRRKSVASKLRVISITLGVIGVMAGLQAQTARAQSTIFNIPSTDAVARQKVYFEFDFISHLESHDNGGFQTYVPRVVVGLGHGVEAGVNIAATSSAAPTSVYIQPNIKWQFYANESAGVALSAGAIAFTPLKDRDVNDSFGLFYANVSKKFKGRFGPRVTAGGYGLAGIDPEDKGGAMLGYEQPLASRASFVADWFSGKNGFGYVTPGFSFALPKSGLLNVGYSIGNSGRKNNGLFVYYGVTF
ncbi:MAG TPA: hypothetical protein VKA60_21275 [Blastocatellia bacterium]|nr:hypothetical protein [Blastocatellia bacterium]